LVYGGIIFGEVIGSEIKPLSDFFEIKNTAGQITKDFQESEASLMEKMNRLESALDEGIQTLQKARSIGENSPEIAESLAKLNSQFRTSQIEQLFPEFNVHTAFSAQIHDLQDSPLTMKVYLWSEGKRSPVMGMIDTGASIICADPAECEKLGIRATGTTFVKGIDNIPREIPKTVLDIEFPKNIRLHCPAAIHPETKGTGFSLILSRPAIRAANKKGAGIIIK
jgi:hypothetical protein